MTLHFEANGPSAIDRHYGLEIHVPRIVPGNSDGQIEYQYDVQIGGKSDGIGFMGATEFKKTANIQESLSFLFLDPDQILKWFLDVKQRIAATEEGFTFLSEFARGLLLVFEGDSALFTSYCYVVLANKAALARLGVDIPTTAKRDSDGNIVLAELYVPCRGDAEAGA